MVISQIFAQTTIDTLSVTIYPEFSYPGVAIEYKFDKFGSDEIIPCIFRYRFCALYSLWRRIRI